MKWITTKTVTVTKTVTEFNGPLGFLHDYIGPILAIATVLLVIWGNATGVFPRP